MAEVQAKPGDGVGKPLYGDRPFTLVEILGKNSARIRVSSSLDCDIQPSLRDERGRARIRVSFPIVRGKADSRFGGTFVLKFGDTMEAGTVGCDGGTNYTLRISDLDRVPVVSDSPQLIAAIAAHASITQDDLGSVQEVRPPTAASLQTRFTDDDLSSIAKLKNLRRLTIGRSSITNAGFVHLKNLNRLVYLSLSYSNISDAALSNLAGLNRLEKLDLFRTKVCGSGLRCLAGLHRLKDLNLGETNLGDEALKTLQGMENLESISLWPSKITRVGFWELHQALPWCLLKPEFVDTCLSGQLERPGSTIGPEQLSTETGDRARTVHRLLVLGCNLRENKEGQIVEASVAPEQAREVFELLAKLGTVEILTMHCDMDESVAAMFEKLKNLRVLHLERCHLTETGWMYVGRLSQLRELHLWKARISGASVRELYKSLPNCKIDGEASRN